MTDNRVSLFGSGTVVVWKLEPTGKRKRALQEKEKWMLLPSSSRPHFSTQQETPGQATREGVPLSAWSEYGYWARPVIGGVEVPNNDSTLCPVPFHPAQQKVINRPLRIRAQVRPPTTCWETWMQMKCLEV